jgi:hypothetical protein
MSDSAGRPALSVTLFIAGPGGVRPPLADDLAAALEARFPGAWSLALVNVLEDAAAAIDRHVLVTPLAIREHPQPTRRVLVNVQDANLVLRALLADLADAPAAAG